MTILNRQWILAGRPVGTAIKAAMQLVQTELPRPAEGDVLVRNAYLSLDAGTRLWMTDRTDSYNPPIPLGAPVRGLVLGHVVESRDPDFAAGDWVRAFGSWSDHSVLRADRDILSRVSRRVKDPRQYLGYLGMSGWTAYYGIVDCGAARAGETVVISAAAGAAGSLAGQVAKAQGCRVVGIVGSEKKCEWIVEALGFDAAVNYRSGDVEQALKAACPNGINLYFDNIGGPLTDAVLPNMAMQGRIAICGLIAHYDAPERLPGPYRYDQILVKRLHVFGFMVPDVFYRGPEFEMRLRDLEARGKLTLPLDVTEGLENTPDAYAGLYLGRNLGKALVKVSDLPG